MKASYEYDQDPRYGWASIDLEHKMSGLIVVHTERGSEGFTYDDGQMHPTCICSAWSASECACSNLPVDYWEDESKEEDH